MEIECPKLESLGIDFGDHTGDLTINCPNACVKTVWSLPSSTLKVSTYGKLRATVKAWNAAIRANLDYFELNVKEPIKRFSAPVFCREIKLNNCEISKKVVISVALLKVIGLEAFFDKYAKNMEELVLAKDEDPRELFPYFSRLKSLRLNYFHAEPELVLQWPMCEKLTKLELVKLPVNTPVNHIWKSCPNLESVTSNF